MKIVHYFLGADLRKSHDGLTALAKTKNIDFQTMQPGSAVIFVNTGNDKLKAYSANGVISYIRFQDRRRAIDMNALDEIARAFTPSGTLNYDKALRAALQKRSQAKARRFDSLEFK